MDNCKSLKSSKLSVVVPVYQAEKTLERCLDSLLKQTFTDFEILLVNDGSTDRSGEIADMYAAADNRVKVIHQKNEGVSAARNAGLKAATGKYLMFVDGDDEVGETFFQTFVTEALKQPCDCVIGGLAKTCKDQGVTLEQPGAPGCYREGFWREICKNHVPFGYVVGKLFKMDIVKREHIDFRPDMYSQEDLDFCLSYYYCCNSFLLIDNTEYVYYYVPGKRRPPVWDFISNQLKLAHFANEKLGGEKTADQDVRKRIELLIYTYLYQAQQSDTFDDAVKRIQKVEGLSAYLRNTKVVDEKSRITNWFASGRYRLIYFYMKVRNMVRDFVRALHRR